jgi:hypothetical protein
MTAHNRNPFIDKAGNYLTPGQAGYLLSLLTVPELELELSELPDFFSLTLALELLEDALSLPARFFLSPVLKSVSYQPPPFKRNAAAETFFLNVDFPHAGQSFSGSSLIF